MSADAHNRGRLEHGRYYCRRCAETKDVVVPGWPRRSMGAYAGTLCDACWRDDGLNHDRKFDPLDAGETLESDEGGW